MSTDFHRLLFDISEALVTDELAALKFLSLEHIPMRKLEAIQEPKAFFQILHEKDMIEAGKLDFLKELLFRIGRIDLLSDHLGSSREQMERDLQAPGRAQVSAYRQLVYGIAEDLTPEDVKCLKFLLQKQLPKSKLQDNASMLQVFLEMERNGIIKEDNLTVLKDLLMRFRADLKKRIDIYEEKRKVLNCSIYPLLLRKVFQGRTPEKIPRQEAKEETKDLPVKTYKMKNNPHGYCVILNNHVFKNLDCNREGIVKDREAVKRVFQWLQFETVEYIDLETKQIYEKVKEYSDKDHSNMDCFVCFIFSHGEFINTEDLLSFFSGSNCSSLAGKPKLFFIQTCQGSVGHPAVQVEGDVSGCLETDATPLTSIPDKADILVVMATMEGYECSIETGSVYIQCLCDQIKLLCPFRKDLMTILTKVNKKMERKVSGECKQVAKISTTLLKQLIFEIPNCQSSEK
ncbi:PREDICTED: caspase-8-like [Acanthisitta chloris]|uniref:caspase-8-like n=1 Tax=Acanthisitta chloris TaxID=57068 RepID=UPI0004F0F23A|nr:PREDICTED: caspase-8-like [Acanthisitta chloris]